VASLGYADNFFLNGASFLGMLIVLYRMRVPSVSTHQQSTFQPIRLVLGTVRDAVLPGYYPATVRYFFSARHPL
jgi:hypothetical protein